MSIDIESIPVCPHWDSKRGTCMYNKKEAMQFLNSVGAVNRNGSKRSYVDPQAEWSSEDWERYYKMMETLADGAGGLELPTGIIFCGEGEGGKNIFCSIREAEMKKT